MRLGVIISMYEEYENTLENIKKIRNYNFPIILIQSKPKDPNKKINSNLVDY